MDEMQVTVIEVTVTDKVAQSDGTQYVCDNANNYVIRFVFDDEWSSVPVKTARFKWGNNKHHNEVFEGDTVPVPKLSDIYRFTVGVFAGDLIASTEAVVQCKPSVLGGDGQPEDPESDVYGQIMEKINALEVYYDPNAFVDDVLAALPDLPGGEPNAVLYTAQELTEEQQAQARENIGAATKIVGSAGEFVVIGVDGNVTTKTIAIAEEATY